jgi:hypothetical protein
MRVMVALAAGLLLAACSTGEEQAVPVMSASATPTTSAAASDCSTDVRSGIVETIQGQQKAFGDRDFARARAFASESFRSSVDTQTFAAIVERDFSFLLDDPALDFTECALVDGVARMQVRIAGSPALTMTYRLLAEGDAWRIDGAGNPVPDQSVDA